MGGNLTAWKTWVRPDGALIRVYVAAGIAVAGALLWFQRDDPRYPTAADVADIMGGVVERAYAVYGADADLPFDYDLDGTNSVGFYAPRAFFYSDLPAEMYKLRQTEPGSGDIHGFLDLRGDPSSGLSKIQGRPWPEYEFHPFHTNEFVNLPWWRSNIYAGASQFGNYEYLASNRWYSTTNILSQAARPLTLMRWTTQPEFSAGDAFTLTWSGTSDWYTSSGDIGAALAEAVARMAAANADGDTNQLTGATIAYHYAWATYHTDEADPPDYRVVALERANGYTSPGRYVWPELTNQVNSVWSLAVLIDPVGTVLPGLVGDWEYYHEVGAVPDQWEALVSAPDPTGKHLATMAGFEGRFDSPPLVMDVNPDKVSGLTNNAVGWRLQETAFLIDWHFQCFTNPAAF